MRYIDKFTFVAFLITFITYNIVGYIFDVDVLKFIIFRKDGFSMSFVAIFVPVITAYLIYFILRLFNINDNSNE
jgi:hypothetical protein